MTQGRIMKKYLLFAIICIFFLIVFFNAMPAVGQSDTSLGIIPDSSVINDNNAVITLTRGGQDCPPAYELAIYEDGTVIYRGIKFVKTEGIVTTIIGKEKVKQIIDEFEKIDFFSIDRNYIGIDTPLATISLSLHGNKKSVINSYLTYTDIKKVQELIALEDKIDEIVHTEQWTK